MSAAFIGLDLAKSGVALLGKGDRRARPHGASDDAAVRQALRQAAEERPGRRRSDLRGGAAAEYAVCGGQERGAAEHPGDPPGDVPLDVADLSWALLP